MNTGTYISGAVHIGLIGWLMFGDIFTSKPPEPLVTNVSVIDAAQFDALVSSTKAPDVAVELSLMPVPPEPDQDPRPDPASPDSAPDVSPAPEPTSAQAPETPPDVSGIQILPDANVSLETPTLALPSEEVGPDVKIDNSPENKPREAPRVAPVPVIRPQLDVAVDDVVRESATPSPEPPALTPPDTTDAAPQEATTEIVTEAETPSGAPTSVPVPRLRPQSTQPATATAPAKPDTSIDALAAALAEAAAVPDAAEAQTPAGPVGPPLTLAEQNNLRIAVSNCWNTGSLSSAALRVTVVVGVQMEESGKPIASSIRLVSSTGGDSQATTQAYEAARRAILRCGVKGYDLPKEKFGQWRDIEMTFNPEKMRIK